MFESISDRLIREASDRGEFDDLPGSGKPIPGSGRPYDPNWWVRALIERDRAEDARQAEYQRLEMRVGALMSSTSEATVRAEVLRINEEITELDTAGPARFEPFDVDAVVTGWKATLLARTRSTPPGSGPSENL